MNVYPRSTTYKRYGVPQPRALAPYQYAPAAKKVFRPYPRSIPRGLPSSRSTGFPRMMKMSHTYNVQLALASSGSTSNYYFSCNGLYDPDITGTGTQPLYFDTMTSIYDHYAVIGSKAKITIWPAGTTATESLRVILNIDDDAAGAGTNMDGIAQQKGAVQGFTGGLNPTKLVLTNDWSAKKYFAGSTLANTELQGTASANPTEQSYYRITYRAADGVSTVNFYISVEITYIAIWKELKDILPS